MSLAPGTRLGPYAVTALIGEGGMGQVWRGRDIRLDRDVALKILPEAFISDPERLARFEREAKTLASINHPHIAQIYGLEQADGQGHLLFLVDATLFAAPFDADRRELTGAAVPVLEGVMTKEVSGAANLDLASSGSLAFVARGQTDVGNRGLAWVDREGREVAQIEVEERRFELPRLSPDGKSLAVTVRSSGGSDIWVHDIAGSTRTRLRQRPSTRRTAGGVATGSASRSGSRSITLASVSDTSSPPNARRPVSIS
jgi:hypothetical protein